VSYRKTWPVWSERTGQSALAGATDPYDDAVRLIDYGPVALDDSVIQNFPLIAGNGGKVFPVRINPLRTVALGFDFSAYGHLPRRLNNKITDWSNEAGRDAAGGKNYDPYHVSYVDANADQPLDQNLWNTGYRTWVRIGWNLLVSYFHFVGNRQTREEFLAASGNNGEQVNPYFACKDGVVRNYPIAVDGNFMDEVEAAYTAPGNWWTAGSGPARMDMCFARFVGTPPSEDEVSIARPLQGKLIGRYKRGYFENGWAVDAQNRVIPASNSNTIFSNVAGSLTSWNAKWYLEPVAIFDGDSGTPLFMHTSGGPVWVCQLSSLATGGFQSLSDDRISWLNTAIAADADNHTDGNGVLRTIVPYNGEIPSTPKSGSLSGPIQIKRSSTPSNVPSSLLEGELAINIADGKLFYSDEVGTVQEFISGSTDSYLMLIESPSVKAYTLDGSVTADRTITAIYAKLGGGTSATVDFKRTRSGTTVDIASNVAVTTTAATPPLSNTGLEDGDRLWINVSAISAPEDMEIVVEYTQ
jgi:hypothetical protein